MVDPSLVQRIRNHTIACTEHVDTVDALMPGSHRCVTYRQLANDMAAVDHLPVTPIYTDLESA